MADLILAPASQRAWAYSERTIWLARDVCSAFGRFKARKGSGEAIIKEGEASGIF